jgi:hypothetical protein
VGRASRSTAPRKTCDELWHDLEAGREARNAALETEEDVADIRGIVDAQNRIVHEVKRRGSLPARIAALKADDDPDRLLPTDTRARTAAVAEKPKRYPFNRRGWRAHLTSTRGAGLAAVRRVPRRRPRGRSGPRAATGTTEAAEGPPHRRAVLTLRRAATGERFEFTSLHRLMCQRIWGQSAALWRGLTNCSLGWTRMSTAEVGSSSG